MKLEKLLLACSCVLLLFSGTFILRLHGTDDVPVQAPVKNTRCAYVPVIDPGHGGEDGGAVSLSGVCESDINLSISIKMRDIFALFGISPVMTRTSAELDYPETAQTIRQRKAADQKQRAALINSVNDGFLLSIHQNHYPSAAPFGGQALYAVTPASKEFAEYLQAKMQEHLISPNKRSAEQIADSIYLMKNAECPAVLIECGFLSNPTEEALLRSDEYQLKTAMVITASFLSFTDSRQMTEMER